MSLQNEITNIETEFNGRNISLADICLKPLEPDNMNCAIMSILQYFQNDAETLDHETFETMADYTIHLASCFEGPFQVNDKQFGKPCLSLFSAPIYPYVVLGGYEKENYGNATALVITFVVKNYLDTNANEQAKEWERAMIEFIKSYKNPNMTIRFITERSIQDEINRESQSDVATVLISYSVMFIYIAFALGQYNAYQGNICYFFVS